MTSPLRRHRICGPAGNYRVRAGTRRRLMSEKSKEKRVRKEIHEWRTLT